MATEGGLRAGLDVNSRTVAAALCGRGTFPARRRAAAAPGMTGAAAAATAVPAATRNRRRVHTAPSTSRAFSIRKTPARQGPHEKSIKNPDCKPSEKCRCCVHGHSLERRRVAGGRQLARAGDGGCTGAGASRAVEGGPVTAFAVLFVLLYVRHASSALRDTVTRPELPSPAGT